jgi:predicted transcriptional regulator
MLITEIRGYQIRDARLLAGLSPQRLADLAGVSRLTIRAYELSSAAPAARLDTLLRVVITLQSAGVEFHSDGGVSHRPPQRPAQRADQPVGHRSPSNGTVGVPEDGKVAAEGA